MPRQTRRVRAQRILPRVNRRAGRRGRARQPAADPRPIKPVPWVRTTVAIDVSVTAVNQWFQISLDNVYSAMRTQLQLPAATFDFRMHGVEAWYTGNVSGAVASGAVAQLVQTNVLGLKLSIASYSLPNPENTTDSTGAFPANNFLNIVEDMPGKTAWARVKISYPAASAKYVYGNGVDPLVMDSAAFALALDETGPTGMGATPTYTIPIRVHVSWRPHDFVPPAIRLIARMAGEVRKVAVIDASNNSDSCSPSPSAPPKEQRAPRARKIKPMMNKDDVSELVAQVDALKFNSGHESDSSSSTKSTARSRAFKTRTIARKQQVPRDGVVDEGGWNCGVDFTKKSTKESMAGLAMAADASCKSSSRTRFLRNSRPMSANFREHFRSCLPTTGVPRTTALSRYAP